MNEARAAEARAAADPRVCIRTCGVRASAARASATRSAAAMRPDRGIGRCDMGLQAGALAVTMPSLGSAAVPGRTPLPEVPSGRTLAFTESALLAAPTDLTSRARGLLRVAPGGEGREVTMPDQLASRLRVVRR
jgi:hypothetical protein